jgi:glycosyltransferase involved in cell wall biosynthesis
MNAAAPVVSVLIATHERRERLLRCLSALAAQDDDLNAFEVIIADDGSADGTAEMLEGLETPLRLVVLKLDRGGKSAAVNAALEHAAGQVCLFLDDDIIASPALVREHRAAYESDPRTVGIGPLEQKISPSADGYAKAHAARWNLRYVELSERAADWADCYGGNMSAPREALRAVGGLSDSLAAVEDIELGFRLWGHGCVPRYLPDAKAVHDDEKPGAKILLAEEGFGTFCASFVETHPDATARLLSWFNEPSSREVLLRSTLLRLGVPPGSLVKAGSLVPPRWRDVWFGFVARYTFWRGVRKGMSKARWRRLRRGVPVLMYHAFSDDGERERFVVSRRSFSRQLALLRLLGYRAVTLDQLARALRHNEELPRRAVVSTIDDGYRDVFEVAFPVLRRHRMAATVFLVSERIGGRNDWGDQGAVAGRPLMDVEEIEEMRRAGIGFGAHTRSHRSLSAADDAELFAQVSGSRKDLQELLDHPIDTFTFPYGDFDERTAPASEQAGFLAACTIQARPVQPGDHPLLIPRIEISGTETLLGFFGKLRVGTR